MTQGYELEQDHRPLEIQVHGTLAGPARLLAFVNRAVILLSMIMHYWSEADDRAILRKCFDALAPGGAVVICELLVNDEKTGPSPAV